MKKIIALLLILTLLFPLASCKKEVSEEFLPPSKLWMDNGVLYWEKLPDVDQYILNLNGKDITVKNNYYSEIEPDVDYTATVKASKIWEISDKSYSFDFKILPSPEKIQYIGEILFWTEVPGAISYIAEINGKEYVFNYHMVDNFIFPFPEIQSIKIKAIGDGEEYEDSKYSNKKEVFILPRYFYDIDPIKPSGIGKQNNPYQISCIENFKWLYQENQNGNTFENMYLIQTSDIDMRYIKDYEPIGSIYQFNGSYDGNGYGIYNLSHVGQISGIFGATGTNANIKNLNKVGGEMEGRVSGGGIVAINNGQVSNCKNYSMIYGNTSGGIVGQNNNNGSVISCENYSNILGDTVGGIVGWNMDGIIISCNNYGIIESTSMAGGVCGNNGGLISISKNSGGIVSKVAGGLAGENRGSIEYSSNDAYINGSMYAGGLVGINEDSISYSIAYGNVVINSATTNSYAGGLVGRNNQGKIKFSISQTSVLNANGSAGGVVGYFRIGMIENAYTTSVYIPDIGNNEVIIGEIFKFEDYMNSKEGIKEINDIIKERDENIKISIFNYDGRIKLYYE